MISEHMPEQSHERVSGGESSSGRPAGDGVATVKSVERHYSPEEVAALWRLSLKTVRRLFSGEPGIIEFGNIGNLNKRRYMTIRIPESVLNRVHRRLRKVG